MKFIPVPSENVLRLLRNLAVGTSYTLAFVIRINFENHKHFIHTTCRVRRNTQISKSYALSIKNNINSTKTVEERINNFRDVTTQNESLDNVSEAIKPTPELSSTTGGGKVMSFRLFHSQSNGEMGPLSDSGLSEQIEIKNIQQTTAFVPGSRNQIRSSIANVKDLYYRIMSLLELSPPQIETATLLFINTTEDNAEIGEVSLNTEYNRIVLRLVLTLFKECKRQSRLDCSTKIFHTMLKCSIKDNFMERFIKRVSLQNLGGSVSLYLAALDRHPKSISSCLITLGDKLNEKTFNYGKYHYTREISNRIKNSCGKMPLRSLGYYIMSLSYEKQYQSEVFEYYVKYFSNATPSEPHHNKVTSVVVNLLLTNRMLVETEQVIAVAIDISRKAGYLFPESICLNLIKKTWEISRDLDKTMALFNRIENNINIFIHPWVFYGTMIKICVDAEDTSSAMSYYHRSKEKNCPKLHLILAQLTFLKAQKGDFEGVENDFKRIDQKEIVDLYGRNFPKILKYLSNKNDITRIEKFIELAFKMGISLNMNSINKIAEIYARDRNFEPIIRLLHYATKNGYFIDSIFVNIILRQFYKRWRFKIDQILLLLELILKFNAPRPIVDINTFLFVRCLIFSKRRASDAWKNKNLEKLNNIFKPYELKEKDPFNPRHLLWEMAIALHQNDPKETLAIYEWAQSKNIRMGSKHLNIAVEACFRSNGGNFSDCIKRIHKSGLSVSQTAESIAILFVHQLQQLAYEGTSSAEDVIKLTSRFISSYEKRGLTVPIQVITQTISTLERLHKYENVGSFWNSISDRLDLTSARPSIDTLTVFLNTYIKLRYIPGFWKIFHIIKKNRIIPDRYFRLILNNARRKILFDLKSKKNMDQKNDTFLLAILSGLELVSQIRHYARYERNFGTSQLIQKIEENIQLQKLIC